jgi:ElaB/YqjD/DUF883 family membrane-anchored ribosome-binding protein
MPETATTDTATTDTGTTANPSQHFAAAVEQAKAGAVAAVEQAKAGAAAFGKQAQDQADVYRDKLTQQTDAWTSQAKDRSGDAIDRIKALAVDGKTRASGALQSVGKLVQDNAAIVDDKVGPAYGDHVRTAGSSLQDLAQRLDAKDIDELASEVKTFVQERPALAVGIAAASGFLLSRLFAGSKD